MPQFLARSISTAKWNARTNIERHQIPADAVTADLRTANNTLSFWLCDPSQEGSLEDVALALASARDQVQRLDLVWLHEEQISRMKIRLEVTKGNTPAKTLEDKHRDLVSIDILRLIRLARGIARAVATNQTKRFTEKQILTILSKAVQQKILSLHDLKESIAAKIQ